jgi:pantetheine-phosphate adenylyltransferase
MTIAMYPGRFDPVTNGHLDIVRRASRIYEEVVVAVAHATSTLFSTEERVTLFAAATAAFENVRVVAIRGLTVDAAHDEGASVLVKGLRAITDFNVEFDMALMNRNMDDTLESTFLMTSVEHLFISGTRIRELASFGRNISQFVAPASAEALVQRFADGATR